MEHESILGSIKKMLGIPSEYHDYDTDIMLNINSVFGILFQLAVGPRDKPYAITGEENLWTDFITNPSDLPIVISYMYLRVKLLFDPPSTGVLHQAIERQISEFEWRLNVQGEEESTDDV